MLSLLNSAKHLCKTISNLYTFLQNIETEQILLMHAMWANIILKAKQPMILKKKKEVHIKISHEHICKDSQHHIRK